MISVVRPGWAAILERGLLAGGFVVLFAVMPHALEGDDFQRFADIQLLLNHGHLSHSRFSLVMPLVSAPLLLLGHLVRSPSWWATRFNVVVVAVGALVTWRLLRGRVEAVLLRRTLLLVLFASLLTNRLRAYDPEVLDGTLLAIGIVCIGTRRHVAAGWTAIVVAAVNSPALVLALVPFAGYETFRTRRLRPLAFLGLAAILVMGESWLRRGGPLHTGYANDHGFATILPYSGRPGFSYPFLLGVASIVFSFGRGLLFFAPGLALWLSARTRRAATRVRPFLVPMLLVVLGMVIVYAKWWAWYGGLSWGPRFFAFAALPASLIVALRIGLAGESAGADIVTLGVLALSAWVGVTGAVADFSQLEFCARNHYALESLCWYVPEYSSLWWPILHPPAVTATTAIMVCWCAAVFVCLALPLVAALISAARHRPAVRLSGGWRF